MAKIRFTDKFRSEEQMKNIINEEMESNGKCIFDVYASHKDSEFAYLLEEVGEGIKVYVKDAGIQDRHIYPNLEEAKKGVFWNLGLGILDNKD